MGSGWMLIDLLDESTADTCLFYYIVMSSFAQHGNDTEEIQPPQRPPSPPPHTTFAVRGVHVRLVSPPAFESYSRDRESVS